MKNRDSSHYQRIWRWHFYAGLFVAPFLILLSLTGIVYLFKPQLDNLMYPELMKVAPASQTLDADQLLAKAMTTMPDARLVSGYCGLSSQQVSVRPATDALCRKSGCSSSSCPASTVTSTTPAAPPRRSARSTACWAWPPTRSTSRFIVMP